MSISPEDVRVELKLKSAHIIQLFDALRGDGQLHRLLSAMSHGQRRRVSRRNEEI